MDNNDLKMERKPMANRYIFREVPLSEAGEFGRKNGIFQQTKEWANFRNFYKPLAFMGFEGEKAVLSCIVYKLHIFLTPWSVGYITRGFVGDWNNKELVEEFTEYLKEFCKKKRIIYTILDPWCDESVDFAQTQEGPRAWLEALGYVRSKAEMQPRTNYRLHLNPENDPETEKKRLEDRERYQTVYSREIGSAAAPTAGLHFTPELLDEVREMGVEVAFVTLHVGLGTFRPVKEDVVENHKMHAEHYELSQETADVINRTRERGGRVIAVGTTSCRTLESVGLTDGIVKPADGWTEIFIYPGYKFQVLDGLITNFHLPESTLIMLVSALAGYDHTMAAYEHAVEEKYRFFSFGDAMAIL